MKLKSIVTDSAQALEQQVEQLGKNGKIKNILTVIPVGSSHFRLFYIEGESLKEKGEGLMEKVGLKKSEDKSEEKSDGQTHVAAPGIPAANEAVAPKDEMLKSHEEKVADEKKAAEAKSEDKPEEKQEEKKLSQPKVKGGK